MKQPRKIGKASLVQVYVDGEDEVAGVYTAHWGYPYFLICEGLATASYRNLNAIDDADAIVAKQFPNAQKRNPS